MRILKKIAVVLIVAALALVGVAYLLPRQVHVERSIVIGAPRATVFTLLNGFRGFNKWSPWFGLDPQAKYAYEGPESGVGAKLSWAGDPKKVGSGSQEIVESRPYDVVRTSLEFAGEGTAGAQFALTDEGGGTRVTWGFDTDMGNNPVSRYFGLMMDRMVGAHYEKGLESLKSLAEGLPRTDFADLRVETVTVEPITVAYASASSSREHQAIGEAIAAAYAGVRKFMTARGLKQVAPPITVNTRWDDTGYGFDAAIPIDRAPEGETPAASPVKIKQTYAGKALKAVHAGPYPGMTATYEKLFAYAAASGYEQAGPPWDQYVTDPAKTAEADLITHIYLPVR
jgi:effector-binding domain-containing protein